MQPRARSFQRKDTKWRSPCEARELVRSLTERGCYLKRHGANHDLYTNPVNGRTVPIPRHAEIKDTLAQAIRKQHWNRLPARRMTNPPCRDPLPRAPSFFIQCSALDVGR